VKTPTRHIFALLAI